MVSAEKNIKSACPVWLVHVASYVAQSTRMRVRHSVKCAKFQKFLPSRNNKRYTGDGTFIKSVTREGMEVNLGKYSSVTRSENSKNEVLCGTCDASPKYSGNKLLVAAAKKSHDA